MAAGTYSRMAAIMARSSIRKYDPKEYKVKKAKFEVTKVYDGDTMKGDVVVWSWGRRKSVETVVQLLGINTPDLHVMDTGREPDDGAIEAMHLAKQLEGQTVTIEFAVAQAGNFWIRESQINSVRWDEQRLLAIVYPKRGKESLNEQLVKKGYAQVLRTTEWMTTDFAKKLFKALGDAQQKQRGIWKGKKVNNRPSEGITKEKVITYCLLSFLAGAVAAIVLLSLFAAP